MLCSRCVLPLLALYLLLDEVSAAVSPRNKREANWPDQDLSRLPDQPDLSVGDAGDVIRHVDNPASHSENERFSPKRQQINQSQRKANEKRRKVARLDSIGSFQMSNTQNQKDEPDVYWGDE